MPHTDLVVMISFFEYLDIWMLEIIHSLFVLSWQRDVLIRQCVFVLKPCIAYLFLLDAQIACYGSHHLKSREVLLADIEDEMLPFPAEFIKRDLLDDEVVGVLTKVKIDGRMIECVESIQNDAFYRYFCNRLFGRVRRYAGESWSVSHDEL